MSGMGRTFWNELACGSVTPLHTLVTLLCGGTELCWPREQEGGAEARIPQQEIPVRALKCLLPRKTRRVGQPEQTWKQDLEIRFTPSQAKGSLSAQVAHSGGLVLFSAWAGWRLGGHSDTEDLSALQHARPGFWNRFAEGLPWLRIPRCHCEQRVSQFLSGSEE